MHRGAEDGRGIFDGAVAGAAGGRTPASAAEAGVFAGGGDYARERAFAREAGTLRPDASFLGCRAGGQPVPA